MQECKFEFNTGCGNDLGIHFSHNRFINAEFWGVRLTWLDCNSQLKKRWSPQNSPIVQFNTTPNQSHVQFQHNQQAIATHISQVRSHNGNRSALVRFTIFKHP